MVEQGSNSNLPMLWHHSLMFANLNENPRKSGLWRGLTFENAYGTYRFGDELKILDFAVGELSLDDTVVGHILIEMFSTQALQ